MDNKSTTNRYLAMLELIPRFPGTVSTKQIRDKLESEGFEISMRSVQRDLIKLSELYRIESKYLHRVQLWFFPADTVPRMLPGMDDHTALSFLVLQKHASRLLPPQTLKTIAPWFSKAAERLASRRALSSKWHEKITVINSGIVRRPPQITTSVQESLYTALLQEKCVSIQYTKREAQEPREHIISPLGLVFKDIVVYLVAHHQNGNVIVYALHRIHSVKILEDIEYALPSKGWIGLKSFVEDSFGYPLSEEPSIKLKAYVRGQTLLSITEAPISADQSLKVSEGLTLITATLPNTYNSWEWLRSRGADVTVLEPVSLRTAMIEEIKRNLSQY